MELSDIENKLKELVKNINKEQFIYDLLLAYDFPKATVSRLKSGDLNLSKNPNEILFKKKLLFKYLEDEDIHEVIDELSNDKQIAKHEPRFIIVTDFNSLLAKDTQTKDTLDIKLDDLFKHSDFFFPWQGREKVQFQNENLIDIKAAAKMGQLYDIIILDNKDLLESEENKHALNIFFARLLFCLFAEDTKIFQENIFTNSLANHTNEDGSDLNQFFQRLFFVLNNKDNSKEQIYLKHFPYVNGGLFKERSTIPIFSRKSRKIIIEAGQLDWSAINPDIFGSMVQAIADPEERADFGVHYTSITNILKVINPLFMDELNEAFISYKTEKDLEKILSRIYKLKIFDPACGSGNFLIVTYKELCILEIKIFDELQKIKKEKWGIATSGIRLSQFYGITIKDFDAQIAKLSLWLAEHQMSIAFKKVFGDTKPSLPLSEPGNIYCNNSLRVDWTQICLRDNKSEVYIVGNPPYVGTRNQTKEQKEDKYIVLNSIKKHKILDYISCWFYLASKYIDGTNYKYAFVSTNSITQGDQVAILWPHVLGQNLEIDFAYDSFKWANSAKNNAGVSCVIIGLRNKNNEDKFLFRNNQKQLVKFISPYLSSSDIPSVGRRSKPISEIPEMTYGNYTGGCNALFLTKEEGEELLDQYPQLFNIVRPLVGSNEFINSIKRYCLWIEDKDLDLAKSIPCVKERIDRVKKERLENIDPAYQKLANRPHQFRDLSIFKKNAIIVPIVSSEKRLYLPCGFLTGNEIIPNSAQAIYDPEIFVFSLISSRMHMLWAKATGGQLETRIRYSSTLTYNTFPFPKITNDQKEQLEKSVLGILDAREKFSNLTIAEMYDKDNMPKSLKEAHEQNDRILELCYSITPFKSDDERLNCLFQLYENLI